MKTPSLCLVKRYLRRMFVDALLVACSLYLGLLIRFEGHIPPYYLEGLSKYVLPIALVYLFTNGLFGIYDKLWGYASPQEFVPLLESTALGTLIVAVAGALWPEIRPLPIGALVVGGMLSFVLFAAARCERRLLAGIISRPARAGQERVLIVGIDDLAQRLAHQLQNGGAEGKYEVVGFVDDDPSHLGMSVDGLKVLGTPERIPSLVAEKKVDIVIISGSFAGDELRRLISICQDTDAQIKILPSFRQLVEGRDTLPRPRDLTIEDLLGRKPVRVDEAACRSLLSGKRVLVTGAGGSIGSELCRQIARFDPEVLLMLDNDETSLHDLKVELTADPSPPRLRLLLADITNARKMEAIFREHRPHIVFHSAAYKHVPILEDHPDEAVRVNVLGTMILSALAQRYRAERFVFVSTDKAVNPSSVMGATKRIGELLIAGMPKGGCLFTAVRFGNVLGSRGSVVPTFWKQIELGGPVTVTHPEMKRFFMSIPEAVSLIIQAASLTEGGEIFMLDMGEEIKILDLAKRMIRLRGLRVGKDIEIKFIGVRPGEKLHEELVSQVEERLPTAHPRIFRIRNGHRPDRVALLRGVSALIKLAMEGKNGQLVAKLREMVGEKGLPSASRLPAGERGGQGDHEEDHDRRRRGEHPDGPQVPLEEGGLLRPAGRGRPGSSG